MVKTTSQSAINCTFYWPGFIAAPLSRRLQEKANRRASGSATVRKAHRWQVVPPGTLYDLFNYFTRATAAHHFGYAPGESLKNSASVMLAAGKGQPARRRLRQERRRGLPIILLVA